MAEEKKNIPFAYIGNALRSAAADGVTAFADEVFDTERQDYQNNINNYLENKIDDETNRAKAAEEANATAIIGTDRIADSAVTTEKLADELKHLANVGSVEIGNLRLSEENEKDLNDVSFIGTTCSVSNVQYLLNKPEELDGSAIVITTGKYGATQLTVGLVQICFKHNSQDTWIRKTWNYPAAWGKWEKINGEQTSSLTNFCFPDIIFSSINSVAFNNNYSHKKEHTSRCYVNTIYADRLYRDREAKAVFGGVKPAQILYDTRRWKKDLGIVSSIRVSLSISSKKIKNTTFSFDLISTKNEVSLDKTITCLSIGDSITAGDNTFWDGQGGSDGASWAYWNFVHSLFIMDNIDYKQEYSVDTDRIKYIPVGTRSEGWPYEFTYKGQNIKQTDDYCEGRSGWTLASYLRHPLNSQGNSEGFYDILGLRTNNGVWTGTDEQKYLIGSTCWGEYNPDITEASWNLFRKYIGLSSVAFEDATESQKENLIEWATVTIVERPENPFFGGVIKADEETGRKSRFSWEEYYKRYKTHENDGITPLNDKGTMYKQNTLVCVPKFISICLGTNDSNLSTQTDIFNDIKLMAKLLRESTGAKIILIPNGVTGSQIPEYFNTSLFSYTDPGVFYERNKLIKEFCGNIETQKANGIFFLPSYFIQGYNCSADHRVESWSGEREYDYITCIGDIHPGLYANRQMGYQMYSMILYLLSLEN